MWRPRPASWPWLAAHELRLMWRAQSKVTMAFLAFVGVLCLLVMHAVAWFAMRRFDLESVLAKRADLVILVTAVMLLLVTSSALGLVVGALFRNRDQELILASPLPIRNVYAMRGLAVAATCVALPALLWSPFANMGAVRGQWALLASYAVWLAIGCFVAAIAFAATLGLTRLLGARRGHRAAQVLGAVAAGVLILAMQFQTILPPAALARVHAWAASASGAAWVGPHSVLTWPARALLGDPVPALAVLVAGFGLLAWVIHATTASFAAAAQEDPGIAPRARARAGPARPFRSGLAAVVIAKEVKLIARDPMLIAKALVQLVAMVPLMLILLRKSYAAGLLAASLVLLASMLAGILAWIAVSGEEAPDLLGSAPVGGERLRWLKVAAALLPVAAICVPFLAWYALLSLRLFAIVACFLALSLTSSGVIQVWTGTPGSGRDLRMRARKNWLANLVESMAAFGWAGACYLAIAGHYAWALAPAFFGLAGPAAGWLIGRLRRPA